MVRTINIYYNNRSVQAVVELKNRPTMWHKARNVSLTAGQTEIKIEFPLPIVACNLMIEYADFYENIQASSETLQCPRCSASVPANPGVCKFFFVNQSCCVTYHLDHQCLQFQARIVVKTYSNVISADQSITTKKIRSCAMLVDFANMPSSNIR